MTNLIQPAFKTLGVPRKVSKDTKCWWAPQQCSPFASLGSGSAGEVRIAVNANIFLRFKRHWLPTRLLGQGLEAALGKSIAAAKDHVVMHTKFAKWIIGKAL